MSTHHLPLLTWDKIVIVIVVPVVTVRTLPDALVSVVLLTSGVQIILAKELM